ncbi:hypothetical protein DRQ50_02885 [bacterium]|nr:MAG: hypothetical protein DRQ50_02885 [bacterium]
MKNLCIGCGVALLLALAVPVLAQSSTATGVNREFNPAISVNALLLGRVADQSTERAVNGADLQEAEVQFTSIVDPYWKANLIFAIHPKHAHDHDGDPDDAHEAGGYSGHVEVVYVDGQELPAGLGMRLGKDFLPFGKHVPLHTHQFPFVDAPLAVRTFLGSHGLTETGVRLAHGLPLPWYCDLEGYAVDGKAGIFAAESRDAVFGARLINLFDLTDDATLEVSGSWLRGPMAHDYLMLHPEDPLTGDLQVWGADMTWKWVSSTSTHGPAMTLTGEVILPQPDQGAENPSGWYAIAQYRFQRNWWLGLGTGAMDRDLPHDPDHADEEHHAGLWHWQKASEYKANLTWVPSEFSALRLEVAHFKDGVGDADDTLVSLQFNFTIGSHPAHLY